MMRYKERITNHVEYVENNLNILKKDILANRTNPEDSLKKLDDMIRQVEYLSNLIELEQ